MDIISTIRNYARKPNISSKSTRQAPPVLTVSTNLLSKTESSGYMEKLELYRYDTNPNNVLDYLKRNHPDVSHALISAIAFVNTGYKFMTYDLKGDIDRRAFFKMKEIINDWNYFYFPDKYDDWATLDGLINSLSQYSFLRGMISGELELDSLKNPVKFHVLEPTRVRFKQQKANIYTPFILDSNGNEVSMDYPTFFYSPLVMEADDPYGYSQISSVIESVMFNITVIRNLQRIMQRVGHARVHIKLLTELLLASAPLDVRADSDKQDAFINTKIAEINEQIATMKPEDVFVMTDHAEVNMLESRNGNFNYDITPIISILDSQISSALHTLPSILGRGKSGGSDSAEQIVYVKFIKMIQRHVAETLSRVFTLILRLNGSQGFCKFEFNPVSLRSEEEVENQIIMKTKRCKELVMLGQMTEDEMCYEIRGTLLPEGGGADIYKRYIELETKVDISAQAGDSPANANADDNVQERRNTDEDIVAQGGTVSPSTSSEGGN